MKPKVAKLKAAKPRATEPEAAEPKDTEAEGDGTAGLGGAYSELGLPFFVEGPVMAVFCQRCGTELPMSARFCSNCGGVVPVMQAMPGRPLMRPRAGRQIAGVCLALARSYGWDVGVVRIITALALFFSSGLVGVAYLAAWIGIPEEPAEMPGTYPPQSGAYPPRA